MGLFLRRKRKPRTYSLTTTSGTLALHHGLLIPLIGMQFPDSEILGCLGALLEWSNTEIGVLYPSLSVSYPNPT